MEAHAEHMMRRQFNALWLFNACVGALLVALACVWCAHFRGGFAWRSDVALQFNWHPLLMLLGMVVIYAQSILVYRARRDWPKLRLKRLHAALHLAAFVCAVVGLQAVFDFHNRSVPAKPNLYTMHSWIGLLAVILFALQYAIGFLVLLWPGARAAVRQMALPVHVPVGVAAFFLCAAAAFMGLTEKAVWAVDGYAQLPPEGVLVNVMAMLLAIYASVSMYLVNASEYKRVNPEREEMIANIDQTD